MNITVVGKNIKKLRDERGITQQQLSEILGVSYQTISKWECNITSPDISMLPEIADYFEVSIDSLFTMSKKVYKNIAERLSNKYGHDIEKTDVFNQADNEYKKILLTSNYDHVDLKNYAYLNTCRMKYYTNKAEKYYLDAIALGKKVKDELYYRSLTAYILFLSKLGRAHERIDPHKQMLKKEPDIAFNHITLTFAYFYTDNYTDALAVCKKALDIFPNNAELHLFTGDIYKNLENYDQAVVYWNKAYLLDSNMIPTLYSLAFYYRDNNQVEMAIKTFSKILDVLEDNGYRYGMKFVKYEIKKLNNLNSIKT